MTQLKEPEGFMLIAEVYKILKKYGECVNYYEKYILNLEKIDEKLDEEGKRICGFLEEYFRKVCDLDKSKKYGEMK
ncbi:anaphase-promoting complex component APC8 [Nosema bombycis CQ1]|uniref:Anaphase-promoting complex component APC8 n=1 Tax=Nosema bombycis (strain CQ1 / CVCC 102059) TaxID=578461 RepID=R0KY64_NOSB1|nr:anaphase-promoting complex component APC8 [Nosema bombycis CQ1]|eukprot:EOB15162.1 anaphase-promoting complex component APC8 [Nosema bombycis CQ1]